MESLKADFAQLQAQNLYQHFQQHFQQLHQPLAKAHLNLAAIANFFQYHPPYQLYFYLEQETFV